MNNRSNRARTALSFQDTSFEVVDRDGEPWLRGRQIASALGYAKGSDSVNKLYRSNADEFTEHMTQILKLPELDPRNGGAGQHREERIFSLRGAHMLGMLAKTTEAKAFRQWVLDILEGAVAPQETGRMTYPQRLAYLKERRWLAAELSRCSESGLAGELYDNLVHVSRLLGITPRALEVLAPGLKQKSLLVTA